MARKQTIYDTGAPEKYRFFRLNPQFAIQIIDYVSQTHKITYFYDISVLENITKSKISAILWYIPFLQLFQSPRTPNLIQ